MIDAIIEKNRADIFGLFVENFGEELADAARKNILRNILESGSRTLLNSFVNANLLDKTEVTKEIQRTVKDNKSDFKGVKALVCAHNFPGLEVDAEVVKAVLKTACTTEHGDGVVKFVKAAITKLAPSLKQDDIRTLIGDARSALTGKDLTTVLRLLREVQVAEKSAAPTK